MPHFPQPLRYPSFPRPPQPAGSEPEDLDLSGIDPDVIEQLIEEGVLPGEMAENLARERQAQEAASMAPPQGRQVGGVYVAANPLEHLAALGGRVAGGLQARQLRAKQEALREKMRQAIAGRYRLYGARPYGGDDEAPVPPFEF